MKKEYLFNLFLFHKFKHHLQTDVKWLKQIRHESLETILSELKTLGNSIFDYYIGTLSVEVITEEIYNFLYFHGYIDKTRYITWLNENGNYQEITLSDESRWTLRFIDRNDYIHIHPSRYSKHTIRMKANTLKTVLCTLALKSNDISEITIQEVNKCRTEYLKLSPMNMNQFHSDMEDKYRLFSCKLIS